MLLSRTQFGQLRPKKIDRPHPREEAPQRCHVCSTLRCSESVWHKRAMRYPPWLPILLGFLTAVGPFSTDMYLPAFPAIEADLGLPEGAAQITLATWFAGLAVGQITQGTLSDRLGRRLPLLLGIAIYTIASAGCALAPGITALSLFRLVAAFGGSASMVVPRAMVRDVVEGHAAARMMAQLMLIMGATPILAPSLGSLLLGFTSWRVLFWICTGYGAISFLLTWRLLPDTLEPSRRIKLGLGALAARYVMILRERGFLSNALMGSFAMFAMFAYISGSPPVFIERFHFSPTQYGLTFGLCAFSFIASAQFNAMALLRFGAERVPRLAVKVMLLATTLLLAASLLNTAIPALIIVPLALNMGSIGFILPNAQVGALHRHAAHAASASALMGTLQFGLGAIAGTLAGLFTDSTPRGMAGLMVFGAIFAIISEHYRPRSQDYVRRPA
jgi:DHA1 family bicyclomycin/chloramphenicol resistance-like MFS transporter